MALISPTTIICISFVTYLVYQVVSGIVIRRRNIAEAARRGCQPAPTVPSKGLFGIHTLRESLKATREERGPIWLHEQLNEIGRSVHTVRAQIFDYQLFITRDTENVKAIFATQSQDWDIGLHRERTFKTLLGQGVMTARGQQWKHSRGLIRPVFARDNVADLNLIQRHLDALVRRLPISKDRWTSKIDLQPLFYNMTLDISTEFLLGQSVHAQDPENKSRLSLNHDPMAPNLSSFGHHLDNAKRTLDRRGALAKYSWLIRDKNYSENCSAVQGLVDYFVSAKLNCGHDEKSLETVDKGKVVLLDELIKVTQDPIELRNELLNVLHAARDTTAALLSWTFYFLARYPEVFGRLRTEIIRECGVTPTGEMTFGSVWSCNYLSYVVNEVIRFVGIVPMNERAAIRDTTLPQGGGVDGQSPIFVPAGTQVLIPTYSMQHREDIWGSDVEEFKPERWEGRKFGWDFIPFGGGARQCLGQQFARTEAMYVVIRLAQMFDKIENLEPCGPLRMHHTIENRSGTGVQIRLHASS